MDRGLKRDEANMLEKALHDSQLPRPKPISVVHDSQLPRPKPIPVVHDSGADQTSTKSFSMKWLAKIQSAVSGMFNPTPKHSSGNLPQELTHGPYRCTSWEQQEGLQCGLHSVRNVVSNLYPDALPREGLPTLGAMHYQFRQYLATINREERATLARRMGIRADQLELAPYADNQSGFWPEQVLQRYLETIGGRSAGLAMDRRYLKLDGQVPTPDAWIINRENSHWYAYVHCDTAQSIQESRNTCGTRIWWNVDSLGPRFIGNDADMQAEIHRLLSSGRTHTFFTVNRDGLQDRYGNCMLP